MISLNKSIRLDWQTVELLLIVEQLLELLQLRSLLSNDLFLESLDIVLIKLLLELVFFPLLGDLLLKQSGLTLFDLYPFFKVVIFLLHLLNFWGVGVIRAFLGATLLLVDLLRHFEEVLNKLFPLSLSCFLGETVKLIRRECPNPLIIGFYLYF